jgi:hypothetical protein
MGRVRTMPRLCKLYPGVCLTTEKKRMEKPQSGSSCVQFGCCVSFEHSWVCLHVHVCIHRCVSTTTITVPRHMMEWAGAVATVCSVGMQVETQ